MARRKARGAAESKEGKEEKWKQLHGVYRVLAEPMPCTRSELDAFLSRAGEVARSGIKSIVMLSAGIIVASWIVLVGIARFMFSTGTIVSAGITAVVAAFALWGVRLHRSLERFVGEIHGLLDKGVLEPGDLCGVRLGDMSPRDLELIRRYASSPGSRGA